MRSKFSSNLAAGFFISLALLIISAVVSWFSIQKLISSAGWVEHTHQVAMTSEEVISNLKDGETGQRGFLLTNDREMLVPYQGAAQRTFESIQKLKSLTGDNPVQQRNLDSLRENVQLRIDYLEHAIRDREQHLPLDTPAVKTGNTLMLKIRNIVRVMQAEEQKLMIERNKELDKYVSYTPIVIVIAALLAIIITLFFYNRVVKDFREKSALNQELEKKDREIASRLRILDGIAQQIAKGNYSLRLNAEEKDDLGSLANSLNLMATSLNESFTTLSNNEWLQTGAALLNDKVAGEKDVNDLAEEILSTVANYTNSQIGALYITGHNETLTRVAGFALGDPNHERTIAAGQGVVGQCFRDNKEIRMAPVEESLITAFSSGSIKPNDIIAMPILFEGRITGVLELATIHLYGERDIQFLRNISEIAGVSLNTAGNRARLKELLEETQAQSEELQAQHSELENMNAELEAHTEKLQTSEEELKVQQEELAESNKALEERSRLLEERNRLIAEHNREIQEKADELAQSTKYKTEFLANMSHELRTPLNSILLLSRMMAENTHRNLTDEQVEYANVIQSSGNSLLQLIDEILDLSKIESGKMEMDYHLTPVEEISASMRQLFLPIATDKGIQFSVVHDRDIPSQIETDRLRLEQIIKNLLSNAIKFTSKGSVTMTVRSSAGKEGYIDFAVKDTGIGIPANKQDAIFEAFQQADGSTRRNYGGTGLGLSISRQLARLLNGDIYLRSKENEGSEFILTVPVSKAAPEMKPAAPVQAEQAPEPKFTAGTKLLSPEIPLPIPDDRNDIRPGDKVILIVEDDMAFARALLDYVRMKNYKGVVIVRGDEAVPAAKQFVPVGILLDLQLPVKDGLEIMDELKSNPQTRPIPVHVMSSHQLKKETIIKGAIDFIQKPMASEQMESVLKKIELAIQKEKKVLIVEDNPKHAKALAYFLSDKNVSTEIADNIKDSIEALSGGQSECIIMDMGIPGVSSYETLDEIRKNPELSNIPIIIFTGKSLSRNEEQRIRQYADSVVIKTAHSYQRILDEVSLFLHLVAGQEKETGRRIASLDNVLRGKTVLITDDDARNIFALGKALESYQMKVITTTDGQEALDALEKNSDINIVLMDIMMPGMDGFETIERIRKNAKWKRLPIIAVTAKAMTGDREKCLQAGASDYITKPVDSDQLVSLMRIWLQDSVS